MSRAEMGPIVARMVKADLLEELIFEWRSE